MIGNILYFSVIIEDEDKRKLIREIAEKEVIALLEIYNQQMSDTTLRTDYIMICVETFKPVMPHSKRFRAIN